MAVERTFAFNRTIQTAPTKATARDALYPLALVGALGIALCGVMMKLIKRKYAANITNVSNTSEASTQV